MLLVRRLNDGLLRRFSALGMTMATQHTGTAGRKAEDGPIPVRYPAVELEGADHPARTCKHVEDSDGAFVITFNAPSGGARRTVEYCLALRRPYVVIDGAVAPADDAARTAFEFVEGRGVQRLHVARRRVSVEPRGYRYAFELIRRPLEVSA
jgi:hypothetical protein